MLPSDSGAAMPWQKPSFSPGAKVSRACEVFKSSGDLRNLRLDRVERLGASCVLKGRALAFGAYSRDVHAPQKRQHLGLGIPRSLTFLIR